MTINRHWLITGVAVITALGLGFGAAQLMNRPAPAEAPAGEDHGDEGHEGEVEGGFVRLSPEAATEAGITLVTVERGGGSELKLPGRIAFAPGAEAAIDAPLGGTIVRVHVGVGDRVQVGTPLVTVRSPDGAASRAEVDAAAAAAEAARAAEQRDRTLFEQGWVSQARLDLTTAETRRAEAELRAAEARVRALGTPGSNGLAVVRSPISGIVTRVSASPGQVMHEEAAQVAVVADPRRIELMFEAPPTAAAQIRVGDRIEISMPGSSVVTSTVFAVAPPNANGAVVVRARATLGNLPPAGSAITGAVITGGGSGALTVPTEAVQSVDGASVVFVRVETGFEARPVVLGRQASGRTEILRGLNGDEQIAGVNAFLLKAELAKGEAEHGH